MWYTSNIWFVLITLYVLALTCDMFYRGLSTNKYTLLRPWARNICVQNQGNCNMLWQIPTQDFLPDMWIWWWMGSSSTYMHVWVDICFIFILFLLGINSWIFLNSYQLNFDQMFMLNRFIIPILCVALLLLCDSIWVKL